jgi:pimeloyl-ACP methyl ester carboxylesterase
MKLIVRNPDPPISVYPKASCDAPYSVPEDELRAAIYIPDTFTYGEKTPVILLPGTGTMGYTSFAGNFIPLLTQSDWADPVWVNVPGKLLEDVQVNAEYAAYALNYIAALTGGNVTVLGWSQGNIDAQWAFKYWPSTRRVTSDHVAISADYRGTVLFDVVEPLGLLNTPSTVQQGSDTDLIGTLRSNGGDSGYVPTTSIYSGFFDEVVQPMTGTEASAYLLDARNVGVTNAEVQKVCPGQPAGTLYTHEGVLYNPLAFALAKDAITHDGPGDISRLDLASVCSTYLTPGLGLDEFLVTENSILMGGLAMLLYQPKPFEEPLIKAYTAELVCIDP